MTQPNGAKLKTWKIEKVRPHSRQPTLFLAPRLHEVETLAADIWANGLRWSLESLLLLALRPCEAEIHVGHHRRVRWQAAQPRRRRRWAEVDADGPRGSEDRLSVVGNGAEPEGGQQETWMMNIGGAHRVGGRTSCVGGRTRSRQTATPVSLVNCDPGIRKSANRCEGCEGCERCDGRDEI